MEELETGKDKIKKICEILKEETLEPAKQEANQIIEAAEKEAARIIAEAEEKKIEIIKEGQREREKEKILFQSTLAQAGRQAISALKQEIEDKLFNKELVSWVEKSTSDPKIASELITALVQAVEKEGISSDFSAVIPKQISVEKVNSLIGQEILKKLRDKNVVVGEFAGGVQIKLHDKKMVLDLSDEAIKDLISKYTRKEFRKILFAE